jgi:spermidine synthase
MSGQSHKFVTTSRSAELFTCEEDGSLSVHFGVTGTVQSQMLMDAPDLLVLDYTRTIMSFLLFLAQPEHIGMIGLGGGSIQKYCYRNLPRTRISVAEISPEIIALRDRFVIPNDDHRFKIFLEDGCDFVARHKGEFDVLIVDGFDSTGQPPQLCSRPFYEDCYAALAPEGIMVVNICDSDVRPLISRIRDRFEDGVIPIEIEESVNMIVFAGKGSILWTSDEKLTRNRKNLEQYHPIDLEKTVRQIIVERGRMLGIAASEWSMTT